MVQITQTRSSVQTAYSDTVIIDLKAIIHADSRSTEWMTRLEAPFWMSQRAWDLQVSHSTSGWQLNLRPYCIRPHDHPVFKHAQNGETEALFELLKSGQASIYDTVQDGQGVLHVSLWFFSIFNLVTALIDTSLRAGAPSSKPPGNWLLGEPISMPWPPDHFQLWCIV